LPDIRQLPYTGSIAIRDSKHTKNDQENPLKILGYLFPALLFTATVVADDITPNSKILTYLERNLEAVTPQMAWKATSPAEHDVWRGPFREKLVELLGEWPERVPADVRWDESNVLETDAFLRRKVYVRTEHDYWAPAYYYTPKGVTGKRPAIMCFHGHSGILPYIREGTDAEKAKGEKHHLDYAPYFAEQGYAVLAVVQRGWNETAHKKPHSCERLSRAGFLVNKTPIGMRVWDGMRLLDFLEAQEVVDPERIACAGLSGGGTTSLFFAALENRIKAALVAGYYCTFRDSIYSIRHCMCNTIPGIMNWGEMSDVAALIAPRPALIISGTKDSIFPIDATRTAYATLANTYATLGVPERLDSDFFEGVHEWSNRKTISFLKKHLGE
jgi:dienelactone hydrolase